MKCPECRGVGKLLWKTPSVNTCKKCGGTGKVPYPTWEEKLTFEQKSTVEKELREYGFDTHQINSLMKTRGRVSELELRLMKELPSNRWGRRPTINVVRSALHDLKVLGLIEK